MTSVLLHALLISYDLTRFQPFPSTGTDFLSLSPQRWRESYLRVLLAQHQAWKGEITGSANTPFLIHLHMGLTEPCSLHHTMLHSSWVLWSNPGNKFKKPKGYFITLSLGKELGITTRKNPTKLSATMRRESGTVEKPPFSSPLHLKPGTRKPVPQWPSLTPAGIIPGGTPCMSQHQISSRWEDALPFRRWSGHTVNKGWRGTEQTPKYNWKKLA